MITLTREEAQQVLDVIVRNTVGVPRYKAYEILHAKLWEPEPEPVAWLDKELGLAYTVTELADADGTLFIPLYTTPPQREWVGLTQDDWPLPQFEYSSDFQVGAQWAADILKAKNAC